MPVRLLLEAEDDLDEAAAFLEQRVPGLGRALVEEVERALARLEENPHVGPHASRNVRKLRVKRFPYNLVYRILPEEVLVIAVAHHRRRPSYWRGRG
ncbi:type II toxin-antitoxin system RelE/ParE family toxin [Longimicrobium sp.]|uniref:type II toxin-antitoxin system RelE/ParE family toxin n=1 Tax=Longimicrobium sp. TaxID=2029185 RepID=UPI0039C8DD79